ncbi:unnamed protein product [Effrenium voratum]|nr:unnamed protein product [Effrenium voratum]
MTPESTKKSGTGHVSVGSAMKVSVCLPSGRSCLLALPDAQATVREVAVDAQLQLKRGLLKLTFGGRLLDPSSSLGEVGVRDGDILEAIVVAPVAPVKIAASGKAFAISARGCVKTWGGDGWGGDSSQVQEQLMGVQQIQASHAAFAAILEDGSVVTWGDHDDGGDSRQVQDQLQRVRQIQAAGNAFAAILEDGSVVTWGKRDWGGDSDQVRRHLVRVQQIQATHHAFAAILEDGSVVTWGDPDSGSDSSEVRGQLARIQQIQASHYAFAAIRETALW